MGVICKPKVCPSLGQGMAGYSEMAKAETPVNSSLVGNGHSRHAGAGWNRGHALGCHSYVILDGADFKDAVLFVCGILLGCDSELYGFMKVKHLMMSVMSRDRKVSRALVTVTLGMRH